ncbi:hypothetical protein HMPREF3215_01637 [Staphylococcus simulans]|nr:hypothetical protein HMPREF3215_01637 [Staphylococcus simulans]
MRKSCKKSVHCEIVIFVCILSLLVIANSGRFEKYTEKSPTNTMLEFVGDLTGEIKYNQMKLK